MKEDLFQGAKSILDIYSIIKKLRAEGIVDMLEVNQLASKRKRELVGEGCDIVLLNKVLPKMNPGNRIKVSSFPLRVQRLSSGIIRVTEKGVVVI